MSSYMSALQATLSPPKNASGDKTTCAVGFHVYPGLQQVIAVGDLAQAGTLHIICRDIYIHMYVYIYIHVSIYLSIDRSIYRSIDLSISIYI